MNAVQTQDSQHQQQVYFDRVAEEFNSHYDEKKPLTTAIIDRIFRQGMVQRFDYITKKMDWAGHKLLDVGCGPGHYIATLIKNKGAAEGVGLDFAASMIDVARRNFKTWGVEDKTRLIQGDFMKYDFGESFDTVLAIGYYDYVIGKPALDQHFKRMLDLATKRVVASFPARWSFKTLPRWAWLAARGCPVQFYSTAEINALMPRMGVTKFQTVRMSGTILLIAEK
jgi:ubiquinone/menaquinone biosynthesis C-methylase UbiE